MMIYTSEVPKFCKVCGKSGLFIRDKSGDVCTVSGRVIEERWRCACGNSVLHAPTITITNSKWENSPARRQSIIKAREKMKEKREGR